MPEGARPSPNIWHHPHVYEIENAAVDRAGALPALMRRLGGWAGRDVLDVGCGTGYHLPFFAEEAASVVGVEPHPDLLAIAQRRVRRTPRVAVVQGTAQALPLPDDSVDVVHARWAYFFGPGCEPGLAELGRVVRPGGRAFVIDNDPLTPSTFSGWFRRGYPEVDGEQVRRFWAEHGWERHPVEIAWTFDSRADLEAVVRIEFPTDVATEILAAHDSLTVDYAISLWSKHF